MGILKDDDKGDLFGEFNEISERPDHEFSIFARKKRKRQPRGSKVNGPKIEKLADERWPDHLDPMTAPDIIRHAQDGDPGAGDQLVRAYQKTMLSLAAEYPGPFFEDRLDTAWEAFWEALPNYDPRQHNNGFYAYFVKAIRGALADLVTHCAYGGIKNESDAARQDRAAHCPRFSNYNTSEERRDQGGSDPDGDKLGKKIGGWISADPHENREWEYTDKKTPSTQFRLKAHLAHIGRDLDVPRACIGVDESPWRNGKRPGIIDHLASENDRRNSQRPVSHYLRRAQIIKLSRSHNAKARMASLNNGVQNGQFGVHIRAGGGPYRLDGSHGPDHWQASGSSS
jgi:Sigma-70 region 2